MNKYRDAVLLPAKTLAADNVETIQLKGVDPISEIDILYKGTNTDVEPTAHPAKLVTGVQILDGSEVIFSLSAQEIIPLMYHHYKASPLNGINYINDNQCWISLRLPFGRWLWDSELALDPARFKNLQLIITSDLNGGGAAPDAGSLEVIARCFDGKKISPMGYLRNRQAFTYALVSSGVQTVELPVRETIKMILFQSYALTKDINSQMNRIKLSENADKHILFDNQVSDITKFLSPDLPPFMEKVMGNAIAADSLWFTSPCYEGQLTIQAILAVLGDLNCIPKYGGEYLVDAETQTEAEGLCTGYAPLGAVGIEFGDPWDMTDWYDMSGIDSLRAEITAGSSILGSSTAEVIVQTVARYGQ